MIKKKKKKKKKKNYLAKFDAASSLHKTELMRGRYQICGAKSGL